MQYAALFAFAFLVAFVYSSVGHGGASGYLALLSLYAFPQAQMSASALALNVLVSSLAFYSFAKAGHFRCGSTLPFVTFSVPAAFLGGMLKVPGSVYALLLAVILIYAGWRLWKGAGEVSENEAMKSAPLLFALMLGAGIGFVSGIVGIGGGIFLSPLLLFFNWATPKQAAATSACFILVNSFAGLGGRILQHHFEISLSLMLAAIVGAAFGGGLLGSRLGANHFSAAWLKRILATSLFFSAVKLFKTL